jgi:hypothetical protein
MAANKTFRFGPIALTTALTTNLLNPPTATGGVNSGSSSAYIILKHLRLVNKTAGAVTASMWIDTTGGNTAGKESMFQGTSVAANSYLDWFGLKRLDAADFLVGGSNTATALSLEGEGEIGVAG